jgi:hypothetical protein
VGLLFSTGQIAVLLLFLHHQDAALWSPLLTQSTRSTLPLLGILVNLSIGALHHVV